MPAPISFIVDMKDKEAHIYNIKMSMNCASARQKLSMPVWAPGSYMVREFAQHIIAISATENGREINIQKVSKNCFIIDNKEPNIEIFYQIYAFDPSIRSAYLDNQQAFFNGTSLFLRPHEHDGAKYQIEIESIGQNWQVATAMPAVAIDSRGFGKYEAASYEELVDYPFQISPMQRLVFKVGDRPHEIILAGDVRDFDEKRLIQDISALCHEQIAFFGGAPFERYLFIARFEEGAGGGLEHRNSSVLLAAPHSLPREAAGEPDHHYRNFLGLVSHEYFHAWNIKKLKPKNFIPINFDEECYTSLLWLFEGITSYYDDLFLQRSGLISTESYLDVLSKNYSRLMKCHGRLIQSLKDASFDAWIKFYRQNENSNNATVSYYLKGSFIALMLDLLIRQNTAGEKSLDDVMRQALCKYGELGIDENEFLDLVKINGNLDVEEFKRRFIHGIDELPISAMLNDFGIDTHWTPDHNTVDEKTKMSAYIGLKLRFEEHSRSTITQVESDSPAMVAGLCPHDEILSIDEVRLEQSTATDLLGALRPEKAVNIIYARKKRLQSCRLLPKSLFHKVYKFNIRPGLGSTLRTAWIKT